MFGERDLLELSDLVIKEGRVKIIPKEKITYDLVKSEQRRTYDFSVWKNKELCSISGVSVHSKSYSVSARSFCYFSPSTLLL